MQHARNNPQYENSWNCLHFSNHFLHACVFFSHRKSPKIVIVSNLTLWFNFLLIYDTRPTLRSARRLCVYNKQVQPQQIKAHAKKENYALICFQLDFVFISFFTKFNITITDTTIEEKEIGIFRLVEQQTLVCLCVVVEKKNEKGRRSLAPKEKSKMLMGWCCFDTLDNRLTETEYLSAKFIPHNWGKTHTENWFPFTVSYFNVGYIQSTQRWEIFQ